MSAGKRKKCDSHISDVVMKQCVTRTQFIKDMVKYSNKEGYKTEIGDENDVVRILFPPGMLHDIIKFAVVTDNDRIVEFSPDVQQGLADVFKDESNEYYYVVEGFGAYRAYKDKGQMVQENLDTGTKRMIKSSSFAEDVVAWCRTAKKEEGVKFEIHVSRKGLTEAPFVRMMYPRFMQYTGHITIGGSICSEVFTDNYWSPTITVDTFALLLLDTLSQGGAQVDFKIMHEYSFKEAEKAYRRAVSYHGWKVTNKFATV
jgi:hypothetical protein